ncbi:DNA polymerase I [Stratiformator vulcanicus]|uniref:DNA polymerase I n=1 Tax=Stratiformator vulcanicus TaxID=2527980 RepID=A0A517R679_9PLAN|nr:DNA polymerase I [Stratiformator vulcanicus]QDT39379.1 DNA polymerase I [Stratiformator vulcanicus]
MKKLLYLIDTFSLVFQVFHAIPRMTAPKGEPTNAIFGFTRDLQHILGQKGATHVILAMESDGPGKRAELYEEYKANRTEMPEDLRLQIPRILEVGEAFGIPVVSHAGWEADDVIATLSTRAVADGFEVRIVTSDKDARQLLGPQVKLYNCRKQSFLGTEELAADWGIRPDQVTCFQGLTGDATDNIPGVPKIGPKTATKLLDDYHTLEGVLEHAEEVSRKQARENLLKYADQARVSKELATLQTDLPIDFEWESAAISEPDHEKLIELFTEFGFKRFSEEARATMQGKTNDPTAAAEDQKYEWNIISTPAALKKFATQISRQKHLCIDLETTDLNATEAEIVGWAVCWEAGTGYYLPVQSPDGEQTLDPQAVIDLFRPILADPKVQISNQNLKYDLIVLRKHDIEVETDSIGVDPMVGDYLLNAGERSHSLDTLARRHLNREVIPISDLIGKGKQQKKMFEVEVEKAAEYAAEDAVVAFQLASVIGDKLKQEELWDLYWDLERPLIPVLVEMESNGVRVNVEELGRQSAALDSRIAQLQIEIYELAGHEFNIASPKQLQQVLFEELKLPVVKRTKTGPSTDADVLDKLASKHELPARIIAHRQLAKLKGTYLDALPKLVNPLTGNIHASFNQVVAATGRLSSSDPNLQNIPIRTEEGRLVRKAFIPSREDWVLVCADYSQIELRVLAHFSGDESLQSAFRDGRDIHAAVAAEIYGVNEDDVTREMRGVAKTVNFGVIYGQSAYGLSDTLGIPQEEAAAFIDQYLARYSGVAEFITETLQKVRVSGYAETILGRRREINGIRPKVFGQMNLPERTAFNTVIQGSAADLIKRAMINLYERLKKEQRPDRMLLQIHDELVLETPSDEREAAGAIVREEMEAAMELAVPLVVDLGFAQSWYDAK